MARGWGSKSVEEQQAEPLSPPAADQLPDPAQQERRRRRETLLLSRARVRQQLEAARDPRYTDMLRRTLADLERQIADLGA